MYTDKISLNTTQLNNDNIYIRHLFLILGIRTYYFRLIKNILSLYYVKLYQ